jgi:hypothetical protein
LYASMSLVMLSYVIGVSWAVRRRRRMSGKVADHQGHVLGSAKKKCVV